MAKKNLIDPTRLEPVRKKDGLLQVIVETPKGSRNKFSFDVEQEIFSLKKVLPAGMAFPYDFGFLPKTLADDGDPIDVLLLMDEPAFLGILVPLIGGLGGTLMQLNIAVGSYRIPGEWFWLWPLLIGSHIIFMMGRGGRRVGLDGLILKTSSRSPNAGGKLRHILQHLV